MPRVRLMLVFRLIFGLSVIGNGAVAAQTPPAPSPDLHPALLSRLAETGGPVKAWVYFRDKGVLTAADCAAAIRGTAVTYNARAAQRRVVRGPGARGAALFDMHDVPVAPAYTAAVVATGARLHVTSRWLNAVSVYATRAQFEQIALLPCVERLTPVARGRRSPPPEGGDGAVDRPAGDQCEREELDYGASTAQLEQINLLSVHADGYTGDGVIIGILDTGFERSHVAFNDPRKPVTVIAEYDFVDNDENTQREEGDPPSQHEHGTLILGCIAAYRPGELVGGAYDASFILCKTEDTTDEYPAEEDNFVAGLEFIEAHGGDMATASLGYIDWYSQSDLDGATAVTTIAVNIATSLGMHCCVAAGNEYHDSNPWTSSLIAPADAFDVITCGAVNIFGAITSFSSDGPTADGRVKPEVLACGSTTHTVSPSNPTSYTTANGTSLSTPLVAAAVACLIQARPTWTVDELRTALMYNAGYYTEHGEPDPLYVYGYGIIDAHRPIADCNGNGIPDVCDLACDAAGDFCDVPDCGGSADCNANGVPDECDEDCNGNGVPDECDLAGGFSLDCNDNQVPDECDISSGTSGDCNGNDIPDECDLYPSSDVPAQDICADAETVCTNVAYVGSTVGATNDGAADCGASNEAADVWYYYEPFGNGYLTVSLCGSSYDTVLSVHAGCPGTAANEIACDDDLCDASSQVTLLVFSGEPYWIRISGHGGDTGEFRLQLTGPACANLDGDCNHNGIPDECETDCNGNGQPDDCDIAAGVSMDEDGNGIPDECEDCTGQRKGDANCDGTLNAFDIDPFVLALTDPAGWEGAYPTCDLLCVSDCNDDGLVNAFDIDPFVLLLAGE